MELFEKYVRNYDLNQPKIVLKYKHTLRVKALCELLAKELGLSKEDIKIAGLCGLYHDIARFEQAKIFDNFDDIATIDHGDLGYEIFQNEFAEKMKITDREKQIILKCIKYHNKLKVENVNEEELFFVNLVRDADKLDIMYIYSNIPGTLVDGDGDISDIVKSEFYSHHSVNRKNVTNDKERVIVSLAFIWDINFDSSYKIIKENKYYEKMKKLLNNSVYDEYFEEINKFLEEMK